MPELTNRTRTGGNRNRRANMFYNRPLSRGVSCTEVNDGNGELDDDDWGGGYNKDEIRGAIRG